MLRQHNKYLKHQQFVRHVEPQLQLDKSIKIEYFFSLFLQRFSG